MIQTLITQALEDSILVIPPPILSRVYQTISRGFVNLLNAKKITDTRFPFPYAQLLAMFLLMHVILTPITVSNLVEHKMWSALFTFIPVFGMFALHHIAVELENPFGGDPNDLPLAHFQTEMNRCLLMLLVEGADHCPSVSKQRCVLDFAKLEKTIHSQDVDVPRVTFFKAFTAQLDQIDRGGSTATRTCEASFIDGCRSIVHAPSAGYCIDQEEDEGENIAFSLAPTIKASISNYDSEPLVKHILPHDPEVVRPPCSAAPHATPISLPEVDSVVLQKVVSTSKPASPH